MEDNKKHDRYIKRRFFAFLIFAITFILIGRNLTFIPKLDFSKSTLLGFKENISKVTENKKGFYSVYYKDLTTGQSAGIDEHQIHIAASVNKVPVVAALYYLDSKGKIDIDDRLTIQKKDIQDYGTGSIRYQKPGQTYSLRNLAKLALKQSDNTAAHVISVRIGEDKIQELIDSWEMSQTDMKNNKSTVFDMEILFEKIYKGEIANPANTKEFLEFMRNTDFEDRIPKYLSKETSVYHKTGDGEGFIHDVGLIKYGSSVYYLGVMTSDIGEEETSTKDTIGKVSKTIFEMVD